MADTALITGASGGIGEDLARLIAGGGSNVVLVARSADKLQTLAGDLSRTHRITATPLAVDLASQDGVDRVISALSASGTTIDVLVNNAGFGNYGLFAGIDADQELQQDRRPVDPHLAAVGRPPVRQTSAERALERLSIPSTACPGSSC